MTRRPRREIFECPNCGADVPIGSKACRECGSDSATGWQTAEEIDYQSIELPDVQARHSPATGGRRPLWIVVTALVAAAALAAWSLLR
jgi:hypothetical protein